MCALFFFHVKELFAIFIPLMLTWEHLLSDCVDSLTFQWLRFAESYACSVESSRHKKHVPQGPRGGGGGVYS